MLSSQNASLPGARFVAEGDRGTDFSHNESPWRHTQEAFLYISFLQKTTGGVFLVWVFFFSPRNASGGRECPPTLVTAAAPCRGIEHLLGPRPSIRPAVPRLTLVHPANVTATTPSPPGLFSMVLRRIYLCFLCKLDEGGAGFLLQTRGDRALEAECQRLSPPLDPPSFGVT